MPNLKPNFFKQPALGFDEHSQGRTEAQLIDYEDDAGFKLPQSYRELMKIQNGGSVRYEKIAGEDDFSFYGGFSSIRFDLSYNLTNFKDSILCTCDEDELATVQNELAPFYPERLILFAGLDGHSAAYFDYGFRQKEPVESPSIIFIGDDGDDFLHFGVIGPHFANFDDFLQSLEQDTNNQLAVYVGVESQVDYENTVNAIAMNFDMTLESYQNDDRNGHYHFDVWHSSHVPLFLDDETLTLHAENNQSQYADLLAWSEDEGRIRNVYAIFSPNQHRSGTYLYQDNAEINLVIEIHKTWFDMKRPVEGFIAALKQIPEISNVTIML